MTRKEKLTRLLAMKERQSLARQAAALAEQKLQMLQQQRLLETLQVLVQEKRDEIGKVTSVGQLAASHWMGTTLATQMGTTENHLRGTSDLVAQSSVQVAQTSQRQRVLTERADMQNRRDRAERQDKADAEMFDRPRR
ncbi:MAG: hypothetical protein JJ877_12670 [Thalassococcus sp.]|uniref:hypothetical protein n=1 Tax=Thalassococcus sp. TaxID=1928858 RepID=UPI001B2D8560|nr:hypothetical protein [Thalassococcus sp.]MBO6867887.1 hypothetical protein [Thalassococcus sp.]